MAKVVIVLTEDPTCECGVDPYFYYSDKPELPMKPIDELTERLTRAVGEFLMGEPYGGSLNQD